MGPRCAVTPPTASKHRLVVTPHEDHVLKAPNCWYVAPAYTKLVVIRSTSAIEVCPARTFSMPSSCSRRIP